MQRRTRANDPSRPSLGGNPAPRRLTAQEQEIVLLVGEGLSDRVIAHRLAVAPSTVGTYVQRIRWRLGVEQRGDLAAWVNARRDPGHPEAGLRRGTVDNPV